MQSLSSSSGLAYDTLQQQKQLKDEQTKMELLAALHEESQQQKQAAAAATTTTTTTQQQQPTLKLTPPQPLQQPTSMLSQFWWGMGVQGRLLILAGGLVATGGLAGYLFASRAGAASSVSEITHTILSPEQKSDIVAEVMASLVNATTAAAT
jgi:uncharacterized protein YkwD